MRAETGQAVSRLTVDGHVEGVGAAGLQVAGGLVGSKFKTWPLTPWLTMKTEGGARVARRNGQLRLVGDETVGLLELVRPVQGPEQPRPCRQGPEQSTMTLKSLSWLSHLSSQPQQQDIQRLED